MGFIDRSYRSPKESTSLHPFGGPRNYFCYWRDRQGMKGLRVNCRIKSGIQVTLLRVGSLRLSCRLQKEKIHFSILNEHSAQCVMGLANFFFSPLQKSLLVWGRFWNTFGYEQILTVFHNYLLHCKWMYLTVVAPVGKLRNSDKCALILCWFQAGWVSNMLSLGVWGHLEAIWETGFVTDAGTKATIALLFSVLLQLFSLTVEHLWTGWALNNALVQPLVLIAVTNLLCVLKTVTYFSLVFSSVK